MFTKTAGYVKYNAFQVAPLSGAIGAGISAASEILQVRWTHATKLCVIQQLLVTGVRATTAFAAGNIDLSATIARSFTAAGTGGSTLTLTGDNQKLSTGMQTSDMGEIRVATTAALTAGTKTLDAHEIGRITTHSSGGTGSATPIIGSIYLPTNTLFDQDAADNENPLVLSTNEGLIVRCTVPGTGVWNIGFVLKWVELTPAS